MFTPTKPRHTDREKARDTLTRKIAQCERILADPHGFSTYDPRELIADAEYRLRWMDCAPEGANHLVAPLQDKTGTPCGGAYDESVGPSKSLREAMTARGLDWQALKTQQHFARLELEAELDRELGVQHLPAAEREDARRAERRRRMIARRDLRRAA